MSIEYTFQLKINQLIIKFTDVTFTLAKLSYVLLKYSRQRLKRFTFCVKLSALIFFLLGVSPNVN